MSYLVHKLFHLFKVFAYVVQCVKLGSLTVSPLSLAFQEHLSISAGFPALPAVCPLTLAARPKRRNERGNGSTD